MAKGLFIVISAPSGTGKTSICRKFLKACPQINYSVSYTTRERRPNEIEGQDYFFISTEEFQQRREQGDFAEWTENYGNYYGTSITAMNTCLKKGSDLLLDVEPRGARNLKKKFRSGTFVFILPPSKSELLDRLTKRGCETEEIIRKRFQQAEDELKEVFWYDYVIINKDLEAAVENLLAIYSAEKSKKKRMRSAIKQFMKEN